MTKTNLTGLTWISFFSYALTGALVIVTGMVMDNIAQYFNVPVSSMSNTFTFLNTGILVAIFLNAWLMEIIPLKRQLIFGFILMLLAIGGLVTGHSIAMFSVCMFVLGVVSGITMSIGTFLITHLYQGRQRGSRLLFTDSFFSMAGTLFPIIAGVLLARQLPWYWVYCCIGLIYVAIFILTLMVEFPVLTKKATNSRQKERNGAVVFSCWHWRHCVISSVSWALFPGFRNMPPRIWGYRFLMRDSWSVISGLPIWSVCGYSVWYCASLICKKSSWLSLPWPLH